MDYEQLAAELVRAVRGKRSQVAFSRRLRCKSNVLYNWEAGRRWPTASRFLWACERAGIDVRAALRTFYRADPAWLTELDPDTAQGISCLLRDLKGNTAQGEVASKSGLSRFAIARYLKGQAEPKLPDFLRLIEALSLRLLDFLSVLVDPAGLPSTKARWLELQAARKAAFELPWSHAILLMLETRAYSELPQHREGWLAGRLGISVEEERSCLAVLHTTGQIELAQGRYRASAGKTVDTRLDPAAGQQLKLWWAKLAVERLERQAAGRYSYNLFGVSARDYDRIEELLLAYYRELRAIVARSAPVERVALVHLQLLPLGEEAARAASPPPTESGNPDDCRDESTTQCPVR